MLKIGAYIQDEYPGRLGEKQGKGKIGSYLTGLRVIVDSLTRNGYRVEYTSVENVSSFYIVLVSITADKDWLSFLKERVKWPKRKQIVIIGGAGVCNVRPFLPFADCFVLGRGENLIIDIIKGIEKGERAEDEAVIWADAFSMGKIYRFRQEPIYPHAINTEGGFFQEKAQGCPYRCKFCAYTHHRHDIGGNKASGLGSVSLRFKTNFSSMAHEKTMLEILREKDKVNTKALQITALDGFSQRLRMMVNKPITREHFREFLLFALSQLKSQERNKIKLYNIVGLPTEADEDWQEFIEDVRMADKLSRSDGLLVIEFHCTPFRAFPATPAACWAMPYTNYKGQIGARLKRLSGGKTGIADKSLNAYSGRRITVSESAYTESLPSTALAAIALRGTEGDSENIRKLAVKYDGFKVMSYDEKLQVLEKGFDVKKLFGEYLIEHLPTRNIKTFIDV